MEASVVAGVETSPESSWSKGGAAFPLEIRLLGSLAVRRAGTAVELPASRKARALLAFLALAPRPVTRSGICELLWDVPNDPRGELRWCLSKIRGVLDEPDRPRVERRGDELALDLAGCFVDALEISKAMQAGIETLARDTLRDLAALFAGDLLEGLELDRQPQFASWLVAQRRRFRACHVAVLEHLARSASDAESDDVFSALDRWLQRAPLDRRAHEALLSALAERGRIREGEEHRDAAVRQFEAEGLDASAIRQAWIDARSRIARRAAVSVAPSEAARGEHPAPDPRRASIAVMPFVDRTAGVGIRGGLADGLTHDVITRLAKLRILFVIAEGTVFVLSERQIGPEESGRLLNVDYVASGSVRRRGGRVLVTSELVETHNARVIWTDDFEYPASDALAALDAVVNPIVASIAHEIELAELNRAILKPPASLDAWGTYHRGLWHMYRFNDADNELARGFFQRAIELDPTFARAYAGLSFTHWQNAFLHRPADRAREADRAFDAAGRGLIVDERDPAAHWAMGRALWLRGRHDESLAELDRTVELSPNFALGHYTLSFVHCQSGDARAAIQFSDQSRLLSPFDPLLFAMLATRALAHARLGEFDVAADWAIKACARPNAHAHILAIAAHCLAAAGRIPEARQYAARTHQTSPHYRLEEFLASFQFAPETAAMFRAGARRIGAF